LFLWREKYRAFQIIPSFIGVELLRHTSNSSLISLPYACAAADSGVKLKNILLLEVCITQIGISGNDRRLKAAESSLVNVGKFEDRLCAIS
jgi:hypothetical protein